MNQQKRFFIQEYLHHKFYHGGIGNADAEKVCVKLGYEPLFFPDYDQFTLFSKFKRLIYLLKALHKIPRDSFIVFQFPQYALMNKLLLLALQKQNRERVICFITDVDGMKDGNKKLLQKEIHTLSGYTRIIVHNESMKSWVKSFQRKARIEVIECFDFLTMGFEGHRIKSHQIVFAGNLAKSIFLEKVENLAGLYFNIYGTAPTEKMQKISNGKYHGVFPPYEMPQKIEGSFGLVWDGDSITGPGGVFGEYMHLITHHKVSLYIMASLPLICYVNAGAASLIKKYKIGLLISSLEEIKHRIDQVTEEEYQDMRLNMKELSQKISQGECLGTALDKITS